MLQAQVGEMSGTYEATFSSGLMPVKNVEKNLRCVLLHGVPWFAGASWQSSTVATEDSVAISLAIV